MALLTIGIVSLLGLTFLGAYSLQVFTSRNGMFAMMEGFAKRGYLSDGTIYSPHFTGIEGVDGILNILVQFFWPAVSGKHLDTAVIGLLLGAQGVAGWTTTMLEGLRFGTPRLMTFTTVVGMLVQLLGFGFIGPLYLCLSLLTVAYGQDRTNLNSRTVAVAEHQLHALPWATFFGFVVPSVFMALPSPEILSTKAKIAAILLWQPFPVWSALGVRLFGGSSSTTPTSSPRQTISAFRKVYRVSFYLASSVHLLAVVHGVLTVFSPDTLGSLYSPELHPAHLYIPQNPFSSVKVSTVGEGAFWFLQWDYTVTSISYLIWAASLKYSLVDVSLPTVVYEVVLRAATLGPMATGLSLIWERDEYLFAREIKAGGQKKLK